MFKCLLLSILFGLARLFLLVVLLGFLQLLRFDIFLQFLLLLFSLLGTENRFNRGLEIISTNLQFLRGLLVLRLVVTEQFGVVLL